MKAATLLAVASLTVASAFADEVCVAAAASLADVMKVVGPLYEKVRPHVKVITMLGATGMLRAQVLKGAPCDVFIGADRWFGGAASNAAEVVIVESARVVALNRLAVVAGARVAPTGGGLSQWLAGAKKIGIGNPFSVPVGRYTQALLQEDGLWAACESKFVYATNVREVMLWLRQGVVDIGFVYRSDCAAAKGAGLRTLAEYAAPGGTSIELAGAVTQRARNAAEGRAFLEYLGTPEAARVLTDCGFDVRQ